MSRAASATVNPRVGERCAASATPTAHRDRELLDVRGALVVDRGPVDDDGRARRPPGPGLGDGDQLVDRRPSPGRRGWSPGARSTYERVVEERLRGSDRVAAGARARPGRGRAAPCRAASARSVSGATSTQREVTPPSRSTRACSLRSLASAPARRARMSHAPARVGRPAVWRPSRRSGVPSGVIAMPSSVVWVSLSQTAVSGSSSVSLRVLRSTAAVAASHSSRLCRSSGCARARGFAASAAPSTSVIERTLRTAVWRSPQSVRFETFGVIKRTPTTIRGFRPRWRVRRMRMQQAGTVAVRSATGDAPGVRGVRRRAGSRPLADRLAAHG